MARLQYANVRLYAVLILPTRPKNNTLLSKPLERYCGFLSFPI
jgi:hypothetical protein